jgi:OOP family OmpA-OmpF porin
MRHLALTFATFACALLGALPQATSAAVAPITPGPGERVVVQQAALLFDASSTIVEHGHFAPQHAVYRNFVGGMPDGSYEVEAVAFGGYERQSLPLAPFSRAALAQHADEIRKLREGTPIDRVLEALQGPLGGKGERAAVVLFSDGLPSDPVGRAIASETVLAQARALAGGYRGTLCFHTVQAGDDPAGAEFMRQLAAVTSCGTSRSLASLSDDASVARFEREVFLGTAPARAAAAPGDADGDGVSDDLDACPGTPRGARVDARGCWTIAGLEYDTDSANIRPGGKTRLDEDVLPVLRANPDMRVRIDGYTDSRGADAYNQALSDRRAHSVRDYLVGAGIPASRLEARGHGEANPIAPNDSPANMQLNRRTELTVID